jgi:hypothetical protein
MLFFILWPAYSAVGSFYYFLYMDYFHNIIRKLNGTLYCLWTSFTLYYDHVDAIESRNSLPYDLIFLNILIVYYG